MDTRICGHRRSAGHYDTADLVGFHLEAANGRIGKVVHVGHISLVDLDRRTVFVDRTRQEIKDAPEYDRVSHPPAADHLDRVGGYYAKLYWGGKV